MELVSGSPLDIIGGYTSKTGHIVLHRNLIIYPDKIKLIHDNNYRNVVKEPFPIGEALIDISSLRLDEVKEVVAELQK